MYNGIQLEVVSTTRSDENLDLSTMYIGRSDREKCYKLKAEESFPISEQGYTLGKLLDGTEFQLLLDKVQASHSCQNPKIYIVNHFTICQSLHQKHKEFR